MNLIQLTPFDLMLTASLIVALAVISHLLRLDIGKRLIIAALRTAVQLTLIGLVLKILFANVHLSWILVMALVMLLIAGREVLARLNRRFSGWWGYSIGTVSMSLSSFTVTMLALLVIVEPVPWYQPQYAIPLLGMLLGNTMTGVALSLDRLTQAAWEQRAMIEARLMLGYTANQAIDDIRRNSISNGMIPTINSMAAAGVVSLPGMMTGQILSGTEPVEAVKYQILIMFLIAAGTGFGTICAVWMGSQRLFDDRDRLRLDRLQSSE